jgi:hypothetical protein
MTADADETMVKVLEDAACHAEFIAALYGTPKEEIAAARKEWADAREALLSALRAARKDSERLDAMERFARENKRGAEGYAEAFAELVVIAPEDLDHETDTAEEEWMVNGPRTSFGCRLGHGPTLRAAIDKAVAWQDAPNLNDFDDSDPSVSFELAPSESREGTTNG